MEQQLRLSHDELDELVVTPKSVALKPLVELACLYYLFVASHQ